MFGLVLVTVNLLALLFVWNGLKLLVAGPVTAVRLIRVRTREARARRHAGASIRETDASAECTDDLELASAGGAGRLG